MRARPAVLPVRGLPLAAEVRRQAARRRTQVVAGLLVVLPLLLVGAFALGDGGDGGAPALVDLATSGGGNFTLFVLFAVTGFLLTIVVALLAGDTVASEASWSTLRYLLAAPVPRSGLLRTKLVVAVASVAAALLLLVGVSLAVGTAAYGWHPVATPLGTRLDGGDVVVRLAVVAAYLLVSSLWVAGVAFCLGTWTDTPLGAVGGAVLLSIVSGILDSIDALGDLREGLPTHHAYAWLDALGSEVAWAQMARGTLWSVLYATLAAWAAWWHFARKDVLS